jgi:hypothetical protein
MYIREEHYYRFVSSEEYDKIIELSYVNLVKEKIAMYIKYHDINLVYKYGHLKLLKLLLRYTSINPYSNYLALNYKQVHIIKYLLDYNNITINTNLLINAIEFTYYNIIRTLVNAKVKLTRKLNTNLTYHQAKFIGKLIGIVPYKKMNLYIYNIE